MMGRADDLLIYLIAFIILAVIVGIILVWVIVSAVRKRGQSSPQHGADPKPVPTTTPAPAPAVVEKMESPADKEVLRVLRDMSSGAMYLEVDGRVYRSITDIRSPEVSRLVQQVAADMTRFSRNVTPAVSGTGSLNAHAVPPAGQPGQATRISGQTAKPASLIQSHDANISPLSSTQTTGSLARRGEALINPSTPPRPPAEPVTTPAPPPTPRLLSRTGKLGSLPGTELPKKPITGPLSTPTEDRVDLSAPKDSKPKVDLKSFWGRALSTPNATPGAAGPRPLADELETVLQQLLQGLATPPPFEVHFRTASDGRLLIDIDGVSYPGLEAIEDPSAKQLVQIVIKKWEAG
jgi:hypothetical protein